MSSTVNKSRPYSPEQENKIMVGKSAVEMWTP
jgi:hypothetical protein